MTTPKYILSFSVVLLYFLFQLVFLVWAVAVDGECMYVNWLYGSPRLSVYWAFTASIVLLMFLGVYYAYTEEKKRVTDYLFYLVYVGVLSAWLNGMGSMWDTFEFEKGNIDKIEYYGQEFIERNFYEGRKTDECKAPDN
jgi:hypothetical protein